MNDLTKARHYLKTRKSDLQHLTSFGLMFATAETAYREVRLRQRTNKDWGNLQEKEIETALDYAVLRYMKRHNRLPRNIQEAFAPGVTVEKKQELAMVWINS